MNRYKSIIGAMISVAGFAIWKLKDFELDHFMNRFEIFESLRVGMLALSFGVFLSLSVLCLGKIIYDWFCKNKTVYWTQMTFVERRLTKVAMLVFIGVAVLYGGAKPSGGDSSDSRQSDDTSRSSGSENLSEVCSNSIDLVYNLLPGSTYGEIMYPTNSFNVTNLTIFGFAVQPSNVWLGAAWPTSFVWTNNIMDVFSSSTLQPEAWHRLTTLEIPFGASNFVARFEKVQNDAVSTSCNTSSCGFFFLADCTDSDGDGLTDAEELRVYSTDSQLADTDGDGINDGLEVLYGRNPILQDYGCWPSNMFASTHSLSLTCGFSDFDVTFSGMASRSDEPTDSRGTEGDTRANASGGNHPDVQFDNGLPQIPRDDSHEPHTYVFSMSATGTYTPCSTGDYVMSVAADDEASFSLGGQGVSVTWPINHGQPEEAICHLVAGRTYPVSIQYANSAGGAYFLSTCLAGGTLGGSPRLQVTPDEVHYNIYDDSDLPSLSPSVSIVGTMHPDVNYRIGVNLEAGLCSRDDGSESSDDLGLLVYPIANANFWYDGLRVRAVYQLYADNAIIDEQVCTFVGVVDRSHPSEGGTRGVGR